MEHSWTYNIYTCSISCKVTELINKEILKLFIIKLNSCTAVYSSNYNYTSC